MKTEYCSDNSVSLPGIIPGSSGPVGFEPGMFKNDDENSSHSQTKVKSEKDKTIDGQPKVNTLVWMWIDCNIVKLLFPIRSQQKKKKKDKKRHKHKKHRHHKDKKEREKSGEREKSRDRDKNSREREKSKEKKDPNISRLQMQEETHETLSSADQSSSNSNQTFQDMTSTM